MMSLPIEPHVSFVIAVFNEAGNIDLVCQELADKLADAGSHELVFVDDGSSDATAALLQKWCEKMPDWRLLRHDRRSGKSAALRSGAKHARGVWMATMDGDGQNDPADMIALVKAGGDRDVIVAGCREKRRDTVWKRLASRFANGLRQAILDDHCPDTGCGMKAFKRLAFLELPQFEGVHRFLPALFHAYGHQVVCHPVQDRPRAGGVSKYTNFGRAVVGLFDLMGVVWLRMRTKRPVISETIVSAAQLARVGGQ